jgi:hypothetical protein
LSDKEKLPPVVEVFMDVARRYAVSYLAMLPFYMLAYIIYVRDDPDPLGRYNYLIWTGQAKYD